MTCVARQEVILCFVVHAYGRHSISMHLNAFSHSSNESELYTLMIGNDFPFFLIRFVCRTVRMGSLLSPCERRNTRRAWLLQPGAPGTVLQLCPGFPAAEPEVALLPTGVMVIPNLDNSPFSRFPRTHGESQPRFWPINRVSKGLPFDEGASTRCKYINPPPAATGRP